MNAVMKRSRFQKNLLVISTLLCACLPPALTAAPAPPPPEPEPLADSIPVITPAMAGHARHGTTAAASESIDSLVSAPVPLDIISIEHIFFKFDKADLDKRAKKTLDATATFIQRHNKVQRVLIEGNTDAIASNSYNDSLADRRISSVWNYLTAKGIPADLLYTTGLGESRPVDENWTRQGRRRNRHVEVYLIAYPASRL